MTDDDKASDTALTDVESTTRRGEEVGGGKPEAGRGNAHPHGATERMAGTSSARDYTGVDPQEPGSHDDEDRSPAG